LFRILNLSIKPEKRMSCFFRIIGVIVLLAFSASCNYYHEEGEDVQMVEMKVTIDRSSKVGNDSISSNKVVPHAMNTNMVTVGAIAVPASTTVADVGFNMEWYDVKGMEAGSNSVILTVPMNEPLKILQVAWDKEYTIEEIISMEHMANFQGLSEVFTLSSEDTEKTLSIPLEGIWSAMTTTGAPAGRTVARGVWTGSEMCIWGGENAASGVVEPVNTGACYNPDNDTWKTITTTGAPAGRERFVSVWTGSKMCVWGGEVASSAVTDGSCYDPVADSWTPMTLAGAPDARTNHLGVWTGSEMCIWGGLDSTVSLLNTGSCYDPIGDSWTAMTTTGAPSATYYFSNNPVAWTGSEMCVWGGVDFSGKVNSGGCYDPSSDAWSTMSAVGAPIARASHTVVWTGSSVCIWGGGDDAYNLLDSGACYNPVTDSWTTMPIDGNPSNRESHSAVWTGTEMCIFGGSIQGDYSEACYRPATDSWNQMSYYLIPGYGTHLPAVWAGSRICAWGGDSTAASNDLGGCLYR
jgi:N-acetylneuraminic acid mutarotase